MRGTVEEVGTKSGVSEKNGKPWTMYILTINGQKMSTFDNPNVQAGDTVEYETEQKGKYTNLTNIAKASGGATPQTSGGNGGNG